MRPRHRLDGTLVHGSVETYNGSVALRDGTRVKRDVVVERSRGLAPLTPSLPETEDVPCLDTALSFSSRS